jgi:predicted MarR family transcription regulator
MTLAQPDGERLPAPQPAWGLDADLAANLSDLEFAEITLMFGFQRWVEKCMEATGLRGLTALDILVLHAVHLRARRRRLSEIAMVLNVGDPHLIAYALKKLCAAGLVCSVKHRRESHYEASEAGNEACRAYLAIRARFLVPGVAMIANATGEVARAAATMTALTGVYDQAARIATAQTELLRKQPPVRTKS